MINIQKLTDKDLLNSVFVETVTDRIGHHVLASNIRQATMEDVKKAVELYKNGKCSHNIVADEQGWLYDFRSCFVCGKGLGTV